MSPSHAASKPDRILQAVKTVTPMEFFVAKGATNACGASCDSWIAAEGLIDDGAAARLQRVLESLGDRKLPIFFYSPGGDTAQGLAIGRMLRKRGLSAGVAVTVPAGCMQAHDVEECSALMRQPQPPADSLLVDGDACSSACAYAILGAVKREIAPTARLGVHAGYSYLSFADPAISQQQRAQTIERGKRRIARDVQRYLNEMGIDRDLFRLASETKFESLHFLTRAELFNLGIDRREVADSGWHFSELSASSLGASMLTTLVERETVEPTGFRQMALTISCGATESPSYKVSTIALVPDPSTGASQTDIRIASGLIEIWLRADSATRRTSNARTYEIRAGEWPRPLVENLLLATPVIAFVEAGLHVDGSIPSDVHAGAAASHPLSGLGTELSLKALAGRCTQSN
jgi:hypothetical protein